MTPEQQQTYLDWALSAKQQAASDAYGTPLHLTLGTRPYGSLGSDSTLLNYGSFDPREFGYTYDPTASLSPVYSSSSDPGFWGSDPLSWSLGHADPTKLTHRQQHLLNPGVWVKTDPTTGKEYYWGSAEDPLMSNYINKFGAEGFAGAPLDPKDQQSEYFPGSVYVDGRYVSPTPENLDKVFAGGSGRFSPLSGRDIVDAINYVVQSPEYDFVDLMGRVISPGTTIGNFTYNPSAERMAARNQYVSDIVNTPSEWGTVQPDYYSPYKLEAAIWDPHTGIGSSAAPMYSMWQYTDPKTGKTVDINDMSSALYATGIAPAQDYGGALSPSGWMALSSTLGAAGGVAGAVAGAATSGGFSISEAVQAGATLADLADLGFSTGQILAYAAANPSSILANQISSGTGLGAGISQGIAQGSVGALKGYGLSGGESLSALTGGLSGAAGGYVGTEVGPFAGQLASTGASLGVNYLNQPTSGGTSPAPKTPAQSSLLTGGSQNALTNLLADQATQPSQTYSPLAYKNIFG